MCHIHAVHIYILHLFFPTASYITACLGLLFRAGTCCCLVLHNTTISRPLVERLQGLNNSHLYMHLDRFAAKLTTDVSLQSTRHVCCHLFLLCEYCMTRMKCDIWQCYDVCCKNTCWSNQTKIYLHGRFLLLRGRLWYSGSALDCWPTGRVIDPAPGVRFITKLISLTQVVPGPV